MVTFKFRDSEQYGKYLNMINNNYNFRNIRKHCRSITEEDFISMLELPQEYQQSFKAIEEFPASLGLYFFSKLENLQDVFSNYESNVILRMEQETPYIIPEQEPLHVAEDETFYIAKHMPFITQSQIREFTIKRDDNLKFLEGENFSKVFEKEIAKINKTKQKRLQENTQEYIQEDTEEKTQEDFAYDCYIDTATVSRIFNDITKPSKIQLNRLCIGFHMEAEKAIEAFERCKGVDSLSSTSLTDIIMLCFLERKNYNVEEYIYNCLVAFDWFRQDPPRYFPTIPKYNYY